MKPSRNFLFLPAVALLLAGSARAVCAQGVGIGTTTPDRPLTIQPLAGSAEWLSLRDNTGITRFHFNNLSAGFNLVETGVENYRLFVQPGGNVGVGTNAPGKRLDVLGGIGLRNGGAAWDHLYFGHDGYTAFVSAGGAEQGLALRVSGGNSGGYDAQAYTEVLRLLASGYVGVGTSAPFSQLSNTSANVLGSDGNGGGPGSLAWAASQGATRACSTTAARSTPATGWP